MDIFAAFSNEAYHWIGLFGRLVDALPVSYAFGAGMLASVNPCGFMATPVTRIGDHWVSGFRRRKLAKLIDQLDQTPG